MKQRVGREDCSFGGGKTRVRWLGGVAEEAEEEEEEEEEAATSSNLLSAFAAAPEATPASVY